MSVAALIYCFQILSLIGSALTAWKLHQSGLSHRYRFFFWYFLFRIPNSIWPLFAAPASDAYYVIWVCTEPVAWFFHVTVVLELFRLILEKHKGIYSLGRWAMFLGLGTSALISLLSLIPRLPLSATQQSKWMFRYLGIERGVGLALGLFLLFMTTFLVLYTIPLSRNVKIHARIYTVFFFSNFLMFFLQSLFGVVTSRPVWLWSNAAAGAITATCAFAWFFLLNPKGEEVETSQPVLSADHERRILLQLDSLNATLLKVTKN
jgi:hypothetical protein